MFKKLLLIVLTVAFVVANASIASACWFATYQPEVPACLKK